MFRHIDVMGYKAINRKYFLEKLMTVAYSSAFENWIIYPGF